MMQLILIPMIVSYMLFIPFI